MFLRSGLNFHFKGETLIQKPIVIPRRRSYVNRYWLPRHVMLRADLECPHDPSCGQEQSTLGEVDPGTDASADAIAEVISLLIFARVCIDGRQLCLTLETAGVEHLGVRVAVRVVVYSPDVKDNG